MTPCHSAFVAASPLLLRFAPQKRSPRQPAPTTSALAPAQSAASLDAVIHFAERSGYSLQQNRIGPLITLSLRPASPAPTAPLATLSAALLPARRLHIESYKAAARTERLEGNNCDADVDTADEPKRGLLAVSPAMLLFIAALAIAARSRATAVYGLAIDDAPQQHARLVAYLRRFGGTPVARVDDSLASLPNRLLYGGFGTVIRGDVDVMLSRGLAMLDRAHARLDVMPVPITTTAVTAADAAAE